MNCNGDCGSCSGCGGCGSILLTPEAVELLELLGEAAFLPVVDVGSGPQAVTDSGLSDPEAMRILKLRRLVDLDRDLPLSGFDYSPYPGARTGSVALTSLGQEALESMDILGLD